MIAPCFPSHGGVDDVVDDVIAGGDDFVAGGDDFVAGGDDFVVFYQEPTQVRSCRSCNEGVDLPEVINRGIYLLT